MSDRPHDAVAGGGTVTWLVQDADATSAVMSVLTEQGYTVCDGPLPAQPWDLSDRRWVMASVVRETADVADTALAAARGVSLVVTIDGAVAADSLKCHALLDTLARLGPLRTWAVSDRPAPAAGPAEDLSSADGLGDEHRRLLDLLGNGASLVDAASTLFVSLRTASRRLSEARVALGAPSNRAAVLAWNRRRAT